MLGWTGDKQFDLGPINVGQARHTGPLADPVEVGSAAAPLPTPLMQAEATAMAVTNALVVAQSSIMETK